jgi:WD40 repeat protein
MWDVENGTAVGKPLKGHTGNVLCVAYSPNGQQFISGSSDKTIRIWDSKTSTVIGVPLEGHTDWVWSVVY